MAIKEIALAATLTTLIAAGSAYAVDLETAKNMADACEAKAAEEGWKMNIAVVDGGADLVLFRRMEGAFLGSIDIAQMKARSSAMFPFPTRGLGEIAFGKDVSRGARPVWPSCQGWRRSRVACRSRPPMARTSARSG